MKHSDLAVKKMARRLAAAEIKQQDVTDAYWLYSLTLNARECYRRQAVAVLDAMVPPGMTLNDLLISGQESAENAIHRIAQVGHRGISILNGDADLQPRTQKEGDDGK